MRTPITALRGLVMLSMVLALMSAFTVNVGAQVAGDVEATVTDSTGAAVEGAVVEVAGGTAATGSCTTDAAGTCIVTFTVDPVDGEVLTGTALSGGESGTSTVTYDSTIVNDLVIVTEAVVLPTATLPPVETVVPGTGGHHDHEDGPVGRDVAGGGVHRERGRRHEPGQRDDGRGGRGGHLDRGGRGRRGDADRVDRPRWLHGGHADAGRDDQRRRQRGWQ